VILAKHFHRLVRRRFSDAVELRQPLFTRRHLINLRCRARKPEGLNSPRLNPSSVTDQSTAPECGISVVSLAPVAGFAQFAVMGAP
jgi:hypothetical protein